MHIYPINLLLADDDVDDSIFFKEALEELPVLVNLTVVNDGAKLIKLLTSMVTLPTVLFLDLNMPRKTGFECLYEMKANDKLKHLPVIIFSTSFDLKTVNLLYERGAHYYIRKPANFSKLKEIIYKAITLVTQNNFTHPEKEKFILSS